MKIVLLEQQINEIESNLISSSKLYYHGTSEKEALQIIQDGFLKPRQDLSPKSKKQLAPQYNKVYLTSDLKEGIGYAFFRNNSHLIYDYPSEKINNFAYLVIVDGKNLVDVEPDEDIIADGIESYLYSKDEKEKEKFRWIYYLATRTAPKTLKKLEWHGDYHYATQLGKILIKYLTPEQKVSLINTGKKLAHEGNVPIKEVWKIPIAKKIEIRKDINNFKKYSERIF